MLILLTPNLGATIPNMGTVSQQRSLSDALFTKTQQRVLGPLFSNPNRAYHANELIRLTGGGTGAVTRELEKLRSAGLITVTSIGNQKHYQANEHSPLFHELVSIVRKTFGLGEVLKRALHSMASQIDAAFIYGSVAAGSDRADSDIDLFLLGRGLSYADIMTSLGEAEAALGRKVNPTVYSPDELERKLESSNSFLQRVLDQPKLFLIGSERDLVVQGEPRASGENR